MNGYAWVLRCALVGFSVVALPLEAAAQEGSAGERSEEAERSMLAGEGAAHEADAAAADLCRCVGETNSASVDRIEKALRSPLRPAGLSFIDTPLESVVSVLQSDYDMPVQLDTPALDEIGLGPDEPVSIELHNISLRSALRLMLKQLGLTYMIRDEVLMITTPDEAEAELRTCVYDVRDLTDGGIENAIKALIDTITACVFTETWGVHGGGEAQIRALQPGLLVTSQTQAVHEEIRGLLAAIRETRRQQPVPGEAAAEGRTDGDDPLVTRAYVLQVAPARETDQLHVKVRDLIVQSMPDQRWNGRLEDGRPVALAVLPDRIVARHKRSVQDALQKLLLESGVATPFPVAADDPSMGDGRGGGFFRHAADENPFEF